MALPAVRMLTLATGLGILLGGCSAAATESEPAAESTSPGGSSSPADKSTASPTVEPASETDQFVTRFEDSLTALASRMPKPDSRSLRDAFVAAGADESAVEISADVTPTGLDVDAMTGAVAVGNTCVYGHVRDGITTVTELPALSNGGCFVGNQG
ncbi:DUF6993 domain-containing protein [Arthrobacter sp. JZ12]|uniref:DUF6993 domain-containing protein n=1 Tax=Arthrobacter sp. JZ12 TaxID=2654190 RepID=UPI002B472C13|nr:hypothetical protein [Arthrobacter sp. JZ12]